MPEHGLTSRQRCTKRVFDLVLSCLVLLVSWPVAVLGWVAATLETRASGLFRQTRIGREGRPFQVLKLRTMRVGPEGGTTVTRSSDDRITVSGRLMRKFKVDELPQLINVLKGDMSLVGPRPDVPGFADRLQGEDRLVLTVRPGITGPATLAYRHEEELLDGAEDPERYNTEIIWPEKVRLNREYVLHWSLRWDIELICATFVASLRTRAARKDEVVV